MSKIALLLCCGVVMLVVGCGKTPTVSAPTFSGTDVSSGQVAPFVPVQGSGWTLVSGSLTVASAAIDSLVTNMEDLAVQENSYGFLDTEGAYGYIEKDISGQPFRAKITTTSGASSVDITRGGSTKTWAGSASSGGNELDVILGMTNKITGIYGPYQDVQASGLWLLGTVAPYGGTNTQYLIDVTTAKAVASERYVLYHNKDNTQLILTTPTQTAGSNGGIYSGLSIAEKGTIISLLSGPLDGVSYDGYYLYAYTIDWQAETSTVSIIDTTTKTIIHRIEGLAVGAGGAKFLLTDKLLTVSFSTTTATEAVENYIVQQDVEKNQLLWKIKLMRK